MALAISTTQHWNTAYPSLAPALGAPLGLFSPIKPPAPVLQVCWLSTAWGVAGLGHPSLCLGQQHPLAQPWAHGYFKVGTWGCKPMVWVESQWWQGAQPRHRCTPAHGSTDALLDGSSQHGHMSRDRQMDSWMLSLASPTTPSVPWHCQTMLSVIQRWPQSSLGGQSTLKLHMSSG